MYHKNNKLLYIFLQFSFYYFISGCSLLSIKAEETIPIENFYESKSLIFCPSKESVDIINKVREKTDFNLKSKKFYHNDKETVFMLSKNELELVDRYFNKCHTKLNPPFKYFVPGHHSLVERGFVDLKDLETGYKSNKLNKKLLIGLSKKYPEYVTHIELTDQNGSKIETPKFKNKISAVLITNPNHNQNKVSILFSGGIHPNELIGVEHCYDIIYTLLDNIEKNPSDNKFKEILDNVNIWVVPIVNPDGSQLFWENSVSMGRKNGTLKAPIQQENDDFRGVDLNRNFPFQWDSGHPKASSSNPKHPFFRGDKAGSEIETMAMMALAEKERFLFSLSFHSFATKILYPYTIENIKNPDPDYPKQFAIQIAELAKSFHPVKRNFEAIKNIYPVDGTDQDYYYFKYGTIALLAESSHKNIYYKHNIKKILTGFKPLWVKMLKECVEGLKIAVKIVDAQGNPIQADIEIEEFTYSNNEKYSSNPRTGLYQKMVLEDKDYTLNINYTNENESYTQVVTIRPTKSVNPTVIRIGPPEPEIDSNQIREGD
jgi:hypothetical protein